MYDLKKIEENFHKYLKTGIKEEDYNFNEIKITERLLKKQEAFYIPFGHISYFLAIEDEKPVLYAHISSRMDLDIVCIVDENGYEDFNFWCGDHKEVGEKYSTHLKKVKKFNYEKDMKFISDTKNWEFTGF